MEKSKKHLVIYLTYVITGNNIQLLIKHVTIRDLQCITSMSKTVYIMMNET